MKVYYLTSIEIELLHYNLYHSYIIKNIWLYSCLNRKLFFTINTKKYAYEIHYNKDNMDYNNKLWKLICNDIGWHYIDK